MNKSTPIDAFNLDDILLDFKESTTTPATTRQTTKPKKADESSLMPKNSAPKKSDQVKGSKKPEIEAKGLKPKAN
jgi:hypothetical protein